MAKYFIYCRKSSEAEDRQILSIESQTRTLKEYATAAKLEIIEILTESKSAKEPGRPVFNAMMQRLYSGDAQGVLCWKLDRLARNPIDGGAVIWAIKQHGIRICTPTQVYDREDENTILMYIEFGMAQKYVDDLSKNVKRGLRTRAENGWYASVAPIGYKNARLRATGENIIVKDTKKFDVVRRLWDRMLEGLYTPPQILAEANWKWGLRTCQRRRLGGKPLHRTAIYKLFSNPFYYGWFEYPRRSGRIYQGKHEPMVTKEEFDRVQVLLSRATHFNRRPMRAQFHFSGLIRCGACNARVVGEEKHQLICGNCRFKFAYRTHDSCPKCAALIGKMKKPVFLHYIYYRCGKKGRHGCLQQSVRGEHLERQVATILEQLNLPESITDWAVRYLDGYREAQQEYNRETRRSQQIALEQCARKMENLIELKTCPENSEGQLLTDEEYLHRRSAIQQEEALLKKSGTGDGSSYHQATSFSELTLNLAQRAASAFLKSDSLRRRTIMNCVFSNLTLTDKILRFEATKPFRIFTEPEFNPTEVTRPIEPNFPGSAEPPYAANKSPCSTLRDRCYTQRNYETIGKAIGQRLLHCFLHEMTGQEKEGFGTMFKSIQTLGVIPPAE